VEDNGIGMTEEEVEKYITQIAFSGAADFVSKYEKANGDGIIGHFGLGFYSAYMVSENIEIFTKSYKDAPAVRWESAGEDTYTIEETDKAERGTKIVMHIAEGEEEFLKESVIQNLIKKYCSFMPFNIYLGYKGADDKPLNTTQPLYLKAPKDCTEEEYKNFYRDTFMDFNEPLFWIHLNMDYPFKLKGILYFPKVKRKVELDRGQVKLYCNQVFIADNIKEVIPEFLMLLNGVIDCPDIPLNVSRSFLQNDSQVKKITKHIVKKVADKLTSVFKTEREKYEEDWSDIANFIKFGCIKDEEFYSKVKDIIIFKDLDGKYVPITSLFGEESSDADAEKGAESKTVYYVSDMVQQAQYVTLFKEAGLGGIQCDTFIDPHFLSFLEYKEVGKVKFMRIDSDVDGALKQGDADAEASSSVVDLVKAALKNKTIAVKAERLKNASVPAIINVSEYARRMVEMNEFYGMMEGMDEATLILNLENPTVQALAGLDEEKRTFTVNQIYYLAKIAYQKLTTEEMEEFTKNNLALLASYAK
ncbi:MAG: molecular chaperone HtpG, partial [Christensenellaceae bacterium]